MLGNLFFFTGLGDQCIPAMTFEKKGFPLTDATLRFKSKSNIRYVMINQKTGTISGFLKYIEHSVNSDKCMESRTSITEIQYMRNKSWVSGSLNMKIEKFRPFKLKV